MASVPATVWRNDGEYSPTSAADVVDSVGVFLADTDGNLVVDTALTATPLPSTVWSKNESA